MTDEEKEAFDLKYATDRNDIASMSEPEPIEHEHTELPICPYCGYEEWEKPEIFPGKTIEGYENCGECGKLFNIEYYEESETYTTEKEEE